MTSLYLRWGGLLIVAVGLSVLTYNHYQQHLSTVSPHQMKEQAPRQEIRLFGMVRGGTLEGKVKAGDATFELMGNDTSVTVHYQGPPPDNLRELKTLILIGKWNPSDNIFEARDIGLITNYGFVIGAYLIGLIPLAIFLFAMSRRVGLLYEEIKESKLYQEE
ncbi:MAG: cytochrome c maturation protein CcmE [Nitrospinae bacterium]|nr:cytochrome c maturation protein CcmE [Nitrospinota bacterium]